MALQPRRTWDQTLTALAWVALGVFLLVFFYRPIETEDVWWHLATGRWIIENGQVPRHDVFSFTSHPVPWVFTQWLGSTGLYAVFAAGGHEALKLLRALVGIAPLVIFVVYSRRKLPDWLLLTVTGLMAFGMSHNLFARPLMFNMMFVAAMLVWLFHFERTGERKNLLWVLLLGVLWGNVHLGGFAYGITLLGVFWASALIRWIASRTPARVSGKQLRDLSLTLVAYVLTLLISPYGWENLVYPFKVFLVPTFIHLYKYMAFIDEAQPPYFLLSYQGAWFFVLSALALYGLFLNRGITRVLLFVTAFVLLAVMQRNVFFFSLIAGFVIVECLSTAQQGRAFLAAKPREVVVITGLLIALFSGITVYQLNEKVFVDGEMRRVIAAREKPGYFDLSGIMATIEGNRLTGPVFNSDIFGGYLLWRAYPRLKPFVDGRQVDQEIFAWYMKICIDPERSFPAAQEKFKFDLAIVNSIALSQKKVAGYLSRHPGWQLIAVEGSNLLFVRRGAFELPEHLAQFAQRLGAVPVDPADLKALNDFVRSSHPISLKNYLNPPPDYSDVYDEGQALFGLGYHGVGVKFLRKAGELNDDVRVRRAAFVALQWMNMSTIAP